MNPKELLKSAGWNEDGEFNTWNPEEDGDFGPCYEDSFKCSMIKYILEKNFKQGYFLISNNDEPNDSEENFEMLEKWDAEMRMQEGEEFRYKHGLIILYPSFKFMRIHRYDSGYTCYQTYI